MSRKMPPSDYAMATNWIWDALRDLEAASGFRFQWVIYIYMYMYMYMYLYMDARNVLSLKPMNLIHASTPCVV